MTGQAGRSNRIWAVAALAFLVLLLGLLCIRAALPNNRQRPGMDYVRLRADATDYFLPRGTNNFDDVVTLVTARNFARDGFLRTHLLANRGGAQISFLDRSGTICETIDTPSSSPVYTTASGRSVQVTSLNNDCIYIHYPPLADWVFGAMAVLGLQVLHYKILAIILNCAFLLLMWLWIRGQVREPAALLALILSGTLPAFLRWADALFFHPFQYFFLAASMLSWTRYLHKREQRLFVLTWLLYFCEAMVSHQLTICTMIVMAGLYFIHCGFNRRTVYASIRLLSVQAMAPVAAFALLVGLSVSLLGSARTWANLTATMAARIVQGSQLGGIAFGMKLLSEWVADDLVPWTLVTAGIASLVLGRWSACRPFKQALALLATFLVGGVSFWVAFLGTTSEHFWMMYRQIMPLIILLIAFLADDLFRSIEAWRLRSVAAPTAATANPRPARAPLRRAQRAVSVLSCCAVLGWVGYRNMHYVVGDIRWNWLSNQVVNPDNLVRSRLDVIYWREDKMDKTHAEGLSTMPVSGLRVHEPPRWITDFRMKGPGTSHYEVWWLEEQQLKNVQLLVDASQVQTLTGHCFLSFFDGYDFKRIPDAGQVTTRAFIPAAAEPTPTVPYAWVSFSLPSPLRTRATRLSCGGMDTVTLRQIEAYSSRQDEGDDHAGST